MENKIILIGKFSNSQNGCVYGPDGISPCICSGGSGHDATIPKIIEFELIDDNSDELSIEYIEKYNDK